MLVYLVLNNLKYHCVTKTNTNIILRNIIQSMCDILILKIEVIKSNSNCDSLWPKSSRICFYSLLKIVQQKCFRDASLEHLNYVLEIFNICSLNGVHNFVFYLGINWLKSFGYKTIFHEWTCMKWEDILLSDISQPQKGKCRMILFICGI